MASTFSFQIHFQEINQIFIIIQLVLFTNRMGKKINEEIISTGNTNYY